MTIVYPVKDGLYVNLTNRCPCACDFCIRKNGKGAYGSDSLWLEHEPTADEAVAAIEAALGDPSAPSGSPCSELVFCGYGEPTERLDVLLEVARRVKSVRPALPIRVNTNGLADLLAGEPTAAKFKGLVDVVSISLNTATAEEYVALCHPKFGLASYDAMLRFAGEVKDCVPSVMMTVVETDALTPEKRAACEAVCAKVGVPLRVRKYIEKS